MYKPKKHLRLQPLNRLPKLDELTKAFEQAKSAKGCLVELPWKSSKTGKNYSLAVRIELGQTDPVWTLFEGEGSASNATWSVPFQDLDLLNDVLLLSLPQEFDNPAKTMQNVPAAMQIGEGIQQPSSFPVPTITRVTPSATPARPSGTPTPTTSATNLSPIISAVKSPNAPVAPTAQATAAPPVPPPAHTAPAPPAPPPAHTAPASPVPPAAHTAPASPVPPPAHTAPAPPAPPPAPTAPAPPAPPPAPTAPAPPAPPPAPTPPTGPAARTPYPAAPPHTSMPVQTPLPQPYPAPVPYPPALPASYPPPHYPPPYGPGYSAPPGALYTPPYPHAYPVDPATQRPYASYPQPAHNGPDTVPLAGSLAVQPNMPPGAMLGIAPPSVPEVPAADYEAAKRRPGIQLGKLLVEASLIPQHTLDAALLLQDMVKSGALEVAQAAEALARAHNRSGAFETKIFLAKPNPNARFLNISVPPLGQILIEAGLINADALKSALILQEETKTGVLSPEEAIGTFVRDCFGAPRPETNKEQPEVDRAINLLRYAGMLDPQDLGAAEGIQDKHGGELLNILVAAGKLDECTLEAAIQCQYFVNQKRLKVEQAVILLHFCQRSRISLDEAIEELGFEKP